MKRSIILAVLMALVPTAVFAHGTKSAVTAVAIEAAIKKFDKDHSALIPKFMGVKGWPLGTDLNVVVYLTDNTEIAYVCKHIDNNGNMSTVCQKK